MREIDVMLMQVAKRQRRVWTLRAQLAGQRVKFSGSDSAQIENVGSNDLSPEDDAKLKAYAHKRYKERQQLAKARQQRGLKQRG